MKANHKRLISLSNVHRGVGRDFWQSAISRQRRRRCSSLSRYWPNLNLERRDVFFLCEELDSIFNSVSQTAGEQPVTSAVLEKIGKQLACVTLCNLISKVLVISLQ